jgi:anti-sigma regulatory factor (Ser/Thr protein kinase)
MEPRTNTSAAPEFRLLLPAAAANVAIVRQALAGALGVLGLGETRLLDINAAVSEACNNVVVHAYPDADGPMEVRLWIGNAGLEVIVSDKGVGIRPNRPTPRLELQGLGLSLIQTLTEWVEFLGGAGEGTKVRMGFSRDGGPSQPETRDAPADQSEVGPPPGELMVAVSAGPLAAPVLGRVISMLGARAGFSLEGVSEAQLVTDCLAAHVPAESVGDKVQLGIDSPEAELVVRVGPLDEGGAERVLDSSSQGNLPPVLERLTNDRRVERYEGGELLCLSLVNPR